MDKFIINGRKKLKGEVTISGSKNASLPIIAATLLTGEDVILHNVPELADIYTMITLIEHLGKKVEYFKDHTMKITERECESYEAPYEIVRKMRASIAVMGPLLGRRGKAKVSFPGGCAIGPRPIDLHIRGMEELGAETVVQHGYIWAQAKKMIGKKMNLSGSFGPSVLGSENVMMAAVLAEGKTIIEGAAEEPEVEDLANFLNACGAKITGAGSPVIEVEGVNALKGADYTVIPDRIETGTFIAAAGLTGGEIKIKNANIRHLEYAIEKFSQAGVDFDLYSDTEFLVKGALIRSVDIETKPYPYFPTDLQSQMMALVCVSDGISVIKEGIFPDRFMHASELSRMGANIKVDGATAIVKGVEMLSGTSVMASDLRAGAGLVVAALGARGQSEVLRVYHIDRGYENLEAKFRALGADIERASQ